MYLPLITCAIMQEYTELRIYIHRPPTERSHVMITLVNHLFNGITGSREKFSHIAKTTLTIAKTLKLVTDKLVNLLPYHQFSQRQNLPIDTYNLLYTKKGNNVSLIRNCVLIHFSLWNRSERQLFVNVMLTTCRVHKMCRR
jgi:hypothetical protein